jgi:esterase/lipase superfamily enzyme
MRRRRRWKRVERDIEKAEAISELILLRKAAGVAARYSESDADATMAMADARVTQSSESSSNSVTMKAKIDAIERQMLLHAKGTSVDVFFGTDREVSKGRNPPKTYFGNSRGQGLTVGIATVSVPSNHQIGKLERPSWLKLQFSENSSKHIILTAVTPVSEQIFFDHIDILLRSTSKADAFVFVHGYNVSFEAAALRTAQIAVDIGLSSVPIMYSWPSQGGAASYTIDEANSEWSRGNLYKFFEQLATRLESAREIVVIAHSMGSRPVTWALQELVKAGLAPAGKFRQLVLAAPDIDAAVFKRDILPNLKQPTADSDGMRITLYASSKDKALGASKVVHGSPRLGESGPALVIDRLMETIDASAIDTDFPGHSYVISERTLLADLTILLGQNLGADKREYLRVHETPDGRHWAFRA